MSIKLVAYLVAGLGCLAAVEPAAAAGCGGYVNVWVTGCAPWDNNPRRMPGSPGYVAPRATAPAVPSQPVTRLVQPPAGNALISNNRGGVIARDGAGLTSVNHNGLISDRGGALRR